MKISSFPHFHQLDASDCGPTCLRMIAKHYGYSYSVQYLRERAFITREGVSMLGISDAAAYRVSDNGGTDYVRATGKRSPVTLYPALEPAAFRSML